jgi:hypothetical protein
MVFYFEYFWKWPLRFSFFTDIETAAGIEIYVGSGGALELEKLFGNTQM